MQAFAALADETRRHIVEILAKGERPAGEIASQFDMTAQAVSQHLKVLKEAGIVQYRAEATKRLYTLDQRGLAEVDEWLSRVREFWTGRLDSFEREYREQRKKKRGPKKS
jgi:DNA-binding transcriptional ArsR family regulator